MQSRVILCLSPPSTTLESCRTDLYDISYQRRKDTLCASVQTCIFHIRDAKIRCVLLFRLVWYFISETQRYVVCFCSDLYDISYQRCKDTLCASVQTSTQLGVTDVNGTYMSNQNGQLCALRYGFRLCWSRSEMNKCTLCTEQPMSLFTAGHIAPCKASSPQSEI